jgi:uncharacterized membrane protein (UPF0127 family)
MIRRLLFLSVTTSSLLFISSCKEDKKVIAPLKIEFTKEGELSLHRATSDSLIARFEIEIADNDYEIQRGLMDRESLRDDQGMLFIFPDLRPRSFYMKNTLIPLDIIFIDQDSKIVSIVRDAVPLDETSLPSQVPVRYALEMNAGLSERLGLEQGDSMKFLKTK